jgi:hypothetical protein
MPAENPVKKKRNVLKTILYALLVLFIIFAAVGFYFYSKRKPILTQYLQKKVTKESKGLYWIKFSDLDFSLFSGNVYVKNLELIPDTATYAKFIAIKESPDNLYRVKINALDILNIGVIKALFQKKLCIDSVKIDQPELTVINKNLPYNDTVQKENPQKLYPIIKKIFKQAEIKGISLTNGSFALVNKNSNEVKHTALNHINIGVKEVLIDSISEKDASRFYGSKSIASSIKNYKLATPDSLYYLTVKDVGFSSQKRQLLFSQIALTPRYNKTAFYQKVKFSKDRYHLKFNTVAVNRIDLQKFINQKKFFSTSANISNADIEVYNNNAFPEDESKKHRWDNFPHQLLQKVAVELKIDTLNLQNINVTYTETNKTSRQTGSISFNHTSGQIFNVTNDSLAKVKNPFAVARLNTRLLNAADLNVNFKFNLTDKKGAFNYAGDLGAINGELLNQTTIPLGMTKVKSLTIQRLTFNANADNYNAGGTMQLYYKNLQIELLKKEEGKKELQKKGLISALANTFIVKDANPDENGDFRIGRIEFKREIQMPFFYFIWQSVFTGIKSSAGLTAPKEKMIDTTTAQATTFFDRVKSFLGISKEKQQERRRQKKASGQ